MNLVNFPKVRVKYYHKGWVIEIQKQTWYGRRYWTHIVSVAGIESLPWHFNSFTDALEETTNYFKWDLIRETRPV
jgi:hypothetical protein